MLLDCLVYSVPDQYLLLQDEEEDSHIPDKDKDINPGEYYSKYDEEFYNGSEEDEEENKEDEDDFDEGEGSDNEGEAQEEEGYSDWNIRKCAALTLESLANAYENRLTPIFIEAAAPKLSLQNHWTITESSILAFGAVAVNCTDIKQYLPRVLPYLLQQLSSPTVCSFLSTSFPLSLPPSSFFSLLLPFLPLPSISSPPP